MVAAVMIYFTVLGGDDTLYSDAGDDNLFGGLGPTASQAAVAQMS